MGFFQSVRQTRLSIGGHRGHLSDTRENTVANSEELRFTDIDYIEIDVQLSRDEEAVIFHDDELAEKTPLRGRIRDYAVSELKNAFDLCTLDEAIEWCKANNLFMLLEIKCRNHEDAARPVLAEKIASAIERHQFQDRCIPLGIDDVVLRQIKKRIPAIHLAVIVPEKPADPVGRMKTAQASVYLSYLKDLDRELVAHLHSAGYAVDGSVVNTEADLDMALYLGVDMIESDEPEKILDALRKRNLR